MRDIYETLEDLAIDKVALAKTMGAMTGLVRAANIAALFAYEEIKHMREEGLTDREEATIKAALAAEFAAALEQTRQAIPPGCF